MKHPLDELLPEICQLLDTCREDFMQRGLWTEWDQSVRDRITAYNLRRLQAGCSKAPNCPCFNRHGDRLTQCWDTILDVPTREPLLTDEAAQRFGIVGGIPQERRDAQPALDEAAIRADERERCALICDRLGLSEYPTDPDDCAAAIRTLGVATPLKGGA